MPYHQRRAVEMPTDVGDLAVVFETRNLEDIEAVYFLHERDDRGLYILGRVRFLDGPDVVGPLSVAAAEMMAERLKNRVHYLSRLVSATASQEDSQPYRSICYELALYPRQENVGARQGPYPPYLQ